MHLDMNLSMCHGHNTLHVSHHYSVQIQIPKEDLTCLLS